MKKFVIIAFVAVAGLFSVNAMAQAKIAHINTQALLDAMPETKTAQGSLQTYAQSLEADGKGLVDEYTRKMKDFDSLAASMTDNMKEIKGKEIQDIQRRIEEYRQSADQKIDAKRQEVLKPIYDKARKAIEDVAKEKGYGYVLDSSVGVLLVSPAGDDLLPAVKTKLALK
ncbi:OmpH family outer membrane protein [Chitinophaga agrisoli]|uniref:OmpH family outer membrane protein n=1 Tax=Chitinophaga agrisoli TaxID=2607653 RepID=A0A5B2W4G1_9BACT|nr:OmpH family outer membrane protein [Chitinophaga agrisoli]KAA2245307.1 OmpH family outer membrane protein [Chitinophaga agrisoli]